MINYISIALCIVAFSMFAIGQANVMHGRTFNNKLATVLLIIAGAGFRWLFGDESFWDKIAYMLRDVAIGLLVSGLVSLIKKGTARMLLIPGILLIVAYFITSFFAKKVNELTSTPLPAYERPVATNLGEEGYEWLVELGPDDNISELDNLLWVHRATAVRAFPNVDISENEDLAQTYIITIKSDDNMIFVNDLDKDDENVDSFEENTNMSLFEPIASKSAAPTGDLNTNDPRANEQWALAAIGGAETFAALKNATPKKKAKVAILDTGVDGNHEDIKSVFKTSPGAGDKHGHGTHCAGIATAVSNNSVGIASLNWEGKFMEVRGYHALGAGGSGSLETIARSIIDAAEDGADVISLSLGGPHASPPKVFVDAIAYARKLDCVVVVAAGNSNADARNFSPANVPGVICVAATDQNGAKASFSNTTEGIERPISAPGVDILSLKTGGEYVTMSGTSMATPLVAGLCGLIRSMNPDLTESEVYELLSQNGTAASASSIGKIINADKSFKAVR